MVDTDKSGGIQVIARAAAVMRTLGDHPHGLSLAGIAREVDLPRSTVQRIITALEAERLVESLGPAGGFRLGPAFGQLLNRTQSDIISIVGPKIDRLADDLQETVILASAVADRVFNVYCAVAKRELRIVFPVGTHAPIHATAAGKLLLSSLSGDEVEARLPATLEKLTPLTLDRASLLMQLNSIRDRGVAYEREEYIEGVSAVAVPINTYLGRYAIAVLAPSTRALRRDDVIFGALKQAKLDIEKSIGSTTT